MFALGVSSGSDICCAVHMQGKSLLLCASLLLWGPWSRWSGAAHGLRKLPWEAVLLQVVSSWCKALGLLNRLLNRLRSGWRATTSLHILDYTVPTYKPEMGEIPSLLQPKIVPLPPHFSDLAVTHQY